MGNLLSLLAILPRVIFARNTKFHSYPFSYWSVSAGAFSRMNGILDKSRGDTLSHNIWCSTILNTFTYQYVIWYGAKCVTVVIYHVARNTSVKWHYLYTSIILKWLNGSLKREWARSCDLVLGKLPFKYDPGVLYCFTWLSILGIIINLHYYATFFPLS